MKKGLIGKKLGMTQVFDDKGNIIPVTVIEASPNIVVQIKNDEVDGYTSVQLGYGEIKDKHLTKARKGHFEKAKVEPTKYLREFKLENASELNVGDEINVSVFEAGDKVDVKGRTKGKGFQGAIQRHGFQRGRMSHGSKFHRRTGSLGASATPSRVIKGRKLPGQMGNVITTMENLEVVKADLDKNVLLIKGSVPGPKGTVLEIKCR